MMTEDIRFPMKVWNTLNISRGCIVTEVSPAIDGNRKWVAIYPLDDDDVRGRYRYFEIEIPKQFVEDDLDWFQDDESTTEAFLKDLQDLYLLLAAKNLNPTSFDVPWKFNYPHHY